MSERLNAAKNTLRGDGAIIFETGLRVNEGSCIGGAPLTLYEVCSTHPSLGYHSDVPLTQGEPPELRTEMVCTLYQPVSG